VAAKAGVSKGGLLHHFPTKMALLEAMIDRRASVRKASINKIFLELPDEPSRLVKAYVLSILYRDRRPDRVGAPLLAAIAYNPELVKPVRETIKKIYADFASSAVKFERAAIIALAADGLWLQEILSISPFSEEQRNKVIEELFKLLEEGVA